MKYDIPDYLYLDSLKELIKIELFWKNVAYEYYYTRAEDRLFAIVAWVSDETEKPLYLLYKDFYLKDGKTKKYRINREKNKDPNAPREGKVKEVIFYSPEGKELAAYGFWNESKLTDRNDLNKVICQTDTAFVSEDKWKYPTLINLDNIYELVLQNKPLPKYQHTNYEDDPNIISFLR